MKIYVSDRKDEYSLEFQEDLKPLDCSSEVFQFLEKVKPPSLATIENLYWNKSKQEMRFSSRKEKPNPPLFHRIYEVLAKIFWHNEKIYEEEMRQCMPENRWFLGYMFENKPKWTHESISENAAALIRNARLEVEDVEPNSCFVTGKKYQPLYKNVYAIAYSKVQKSVWITYVVCKNLTYATIHEEGTEEYADALEFLRKYRAILECTRGPLKVNYYGSKQNLGEKVSGLFRYHITLSKRYISEKRNIPGVPMDKEGKELALVQVSGFVRNQPYGPGRSMYKKIWVDGFVRGQWVKSGIQYITLKEKGEK